MVQRELCKRQIYSGRFARLSGTVGTVRSLKYHVAKHRRSSSQIAGRAVSKSLGSMSETTVAVTINASVCAVGQQETWSGKLEGSIFTMPTSVQTRSIFSGWLDGMTSLRSTIRL